jgi:lipopolysaccharide export system permease protein
MLLAAVTVALNDTLLPESNHRLSMLMQEIQRAKPTVVLQEQRINDPTGLGEYRILPERIDRATGTMYGVRIFDTRDLMVQRTIIADSGRLDYAPGGEDAVLILWNGTIHHRDIDSPGEYERLSFQTQRLVLRGVGSRLQRLDDASGYRSDREMDLGTLMGNVRSEEAKIDSARAELKRSVVEHVDLLLLADSAAATGAAAETAGAVGAAGLAGFTTALDAERYQIARVQRYTEAIDYSHRQRNKFLVEYHKKFAIPVACIVFILIGAPIGVRAKRGGYGFAMGMSTVVFIIYYLALTGGEDLADRRLLPPWLSMWLANLVFLAFGLWLLRRTGRETAGRFGVRFSKWWRRRRAPTPHEAIAEA